MSYYHHVLYCTLYCIFLYITGYFNFVYYLGCKLDVHVLIYRHSLSTSALTSCVICNLLRILTIKGFPDIRNHARDVLAEILKVVAIKDPYTFRKLVEQFVRLLGGRWVCRSSTVVPLIGIPLLPNPPPPPKMSLLQRCPLVRGSMTYIHCTLYTTGVCAFSRWTTLIESVL